MGNVNLTIRVGLRTTL